MKLLLHRLLRAGSWAWLLLLSGSLTVPAAAQTWQWAAQADGSSSQSSAAVATDAAGNVYYVGSFRGYQTFGASTLVSSGSADVYVAKFTSAGTLAWARRAGGTDNDLAQDIAVDAAGNVYITGHYETATTFGTTTLASAGDYDVFVAKLDASGNWLWAVRGGDSADELSNTLTLDAAGDVYIAGQFDGSTQLAGHTFQSQGDNDLFVAKLSPTGSWLWAITAGGSDDDIGYQLAADASGGIYLTGSFGDLVQFPSTGLSLLPIQSAGASDALVARLDANGVWQWVTSVGGTNIEQGAGIAVDAQGNVVVTGVYLSTSVTFGATTLTGTGGAFVSYVAQLNASGAWQWAVKAGTGSANGSVINDVATDAAGNAYTIGYYQGTPLTVGTTTLPAAPNSEVFVCRFSGTGSVQWAVTGGGAGHDYADGIALDAGGNVYATGTFSSTVAAFGATSLLNSGPTANAMPFVARLSGAGLWQWAAGGSGNNISAIQGSAADAYGNVFVTGHFTGAIRFNSSIAFSSSGVSSGFVGKLNSAGQWLWVQPLYGASDAHGNGIATDAAGNAYVVGGFDGSMSFGSTTLTSAGNSDGFVARIDPDGTWLWAAKAGGTNIEEATAVAVDVNNNAYVIGHYYSSPLALGGISLTNSGSQDVFIGKLNSSGTWLWGAKAAGTGLDVADDIALDASANVYVTGCFNSATLTCGATSLTNAGTTVTTDVFIGKLNSSGTWQWAVRGGGATSDESHGIGTDASGNVFVAGQYTGTATFGATSLTNLGNTDLFACKLNTSGTYQWAVRGGGTAADAANDLAVDASGNPYVTGTFSGTASFGSSLTSAGASDVILGRLSPSTGAWTWATRLGGTNNDLAITISIDPLGNVSGGGSFYSASVPVGSATLLSAGSSSYSTAFMARLCGVVVSSFSPSSGAPGSSVVITGTGFTGATSVRVAGAAATITANSGTSITATLPTGAAYTGASGKVSVTGPAGTGTSANSFTVTGLMQLLADSVVALPGTQVVIPVRVKGFTNLISFQSGLTWDQTKLTFVQVEALNTAGLAGLATANFGTGQTSSGSLWFAWAHASNTATTLADNAIVFSVRFNVNAAVTPGAAVALNLTSTVGPIEFIKSDFSAAAFTTKSGKAQVLAATLTGAAKTGNNTNVPGVVMTITGTAALPAVQTTAVDGTYAYTLTGQGAYTLKPSKAAETTVQNGVTVADIALIQRHILNTSLLGNAYKVVAADVDRSNSVTTTDVAYIREMILHTRTSFPKSRRWLFVRSDQTFANQNSPWPVDTFRTYTNFATATSQNFVACKLGDVNDSWNVAVLRPVARQPLALAVGQVPAAVGQRVTVPIIVSDFVGVSGLQATVSWPARALRLVGVRSTALPDLVSSPHDAVNGHLTLVWTDPRGQSTTLPNGTRLVDLEFEAIGAVGTTAPVAITSDQTEALATDATLQALPLSLTEGAVLISSRVTGLTADAPGSGMVLVPNPAHDVAQIQGLADGLLVELLDGLGRKVRTTMASAQGLAAVELRGLPAGFYVVRAGSVSRRLVVE